MKLYKETMPISWDEFKMLVHDVRTSLPRRTTKSKGIRFFVKRSDTDEVPVTYNSVSVNEDGTVDIVFTSPDLYPLGDNNYLLTCDEYNVLNRLSAISKMDCWFNLATDEYEPCDYVEDLEGSEDMTLRVGVSQLNEELIEENLDQLSDKEREIYKKLLIKLDIERK